MAQFTSVTPGSTSPVYSPVQIKNNITAQKEAIKAVREQIENSYVALDITFDPEIQSLYERMIQCFGKAISSQKIWDVTSAHAQDRVKARSSASTLVKKKTVRFDMKGISDIKAQLPTMYFKNANGADLYFYPSFIVMYDSRSRFAIIDFKELHFVFSPTRFVETGSVPSDSKIIDYTWAKVNKNGKPDKRYKNNHQIPVVRYGTISLRTATGLHEEFEFSNYEACEEFSYAFQKYQSVLQQLKDI